jgi:hypothetical protein
MSRWWDIRDSDNRAVLGWVGTGVAAVIAALWAVFVHFESPKSGDSSGNCNISSGGIGSGSNKVNCDFVPAAPTAKP